MALATVLWAVTALALIAATTQSATLSTTDSARQGRSAIVTVAALEACVHRTALALYRGSIAADGSVFAWRFADRDFRTTARSEAGKVDLNTARPALIAGLLESIGVKSRAANLLAARIADFRDVDGFARPQGAEQELYSAQGKLDGPRNAPFRSVGDLKQVLGMPARLVERLRPHVTVFGQPRPVFAQAGRRVRDLLLPPGSRPDVRARAGEQREKQPTAQSHASDLVQVSAGDSAHTTGAGTYQIQCHRTRTAAQGAKLTVVLRLDRHGAITMRSWRHTLVPSPGTLTR